MTSTPPAHIALTFSVYLVMYVLLIAAYIAVLRYMSEKPLSSPAQSQTGRSIAQTGHDANLPQGAQP